MPESASLNVDWLTVTHTIHPVHASRIPMVANAMSTPPVPNDSDPRRSRSRTASAPVSPPTELSLIDVNMTGAVRSTASKAQPPTNNHSAPEKSYRRRRPSSRTRRDRNVTPTGTSNDSIKMRGRPPAGQLLLAPIVVDMNPASQPDELFPTAAVQIELTAR